MLNDRDDQMNQMIDSRASSISACQSSWEDDVEGLPSKLADRLALLEVTQVQ